MRKNQKEKLNFVIMFSVILFFIMYIYGMAGTYFPEPILLGRGQYLDLSIGIIMVGLLLLGILLAIFFKKEMKKFSGLKRI